MQAYNLNGDLEQERILKSNPADVSPKVLAVYTSLRILKKVRAMSGFLMRWIGCSIQKGKP